MNVETLWGWIPHYKDEKIEYGNDWVPWCHGDGFYLSKIAVALVAAGWFKEYHIGRTCPKRKDVV